MLRQCFRRRSGAVGDQAFGEALGNDVLDRLTDQFVAVVAKLFFRLKIEQDNLAALVHDHHGVRGRLQQTTVLRPGLLALTLMYISVGAEPAQDLSLLDHGSERPARGTSDNCHPGRAGERCLPKSRPFGNIIG